MSKGGENQALSNEEHTLQNVQNIVNALNQQYDQLGLPALQTLFPELMNTVQGKGSPLMTAAEAPVQAATQSALKGAQQQSSGLANPDLLYENIAQSGAQQAGIAGDQALLGSLSSLVNLIGGQQGSVESGLSQLPGVASQYGQIAQQLDPWNAIASIVQAGAQAYGASQGAKTGGSTRQAPSSATVQAPQSTQTLSLSNILSGQPWNTMPNSNVSTPTSQISRQVASAGSSSPSLSQMPFYGAS